MGNQEILTFNKSLFPPRHDRYPCTSQFHTKIKKVLLETKTTEAVSGWKLTGVKNLAVGVCIHTPSSKYSPGALWFTLKYTSEFTCGQVQYLIRV